MTQVRFVYYKHIGFFQIWGSDVDMMPADWVDSRLHFKNLGWVIVTPIYIGVDSNRVFHRSDQH